MTDVYTPSPNSTLGSQRTPVSVVADNDVVSLSVSYSPARVTETVWQQGAFCYPFLQSVRTNARTFSIVRDGGWPVRPGESIQVWVNDPQGAPTGGQAMGVIYDLDLTAQPSQIAMSPGSYTIDGHTWWLKTKGANAGTATCELVNGAGLRMALSSGESDWRGNTNPAYYGRAFAFSLAQIPDYNPAAPVAVEWRFTSPASYTDNNDRTAWAGVADAVLSAAGFTVAEYGAMVALARYGAGGNCVMDQSPFNVAPRTYNATTDASGVMGHDVIGLYRVSRHRWTPLAGRYGSAMGMPDDYEGFQSAATIPTLVHSSMSASPSFIFTLNTSGAGNDISLTNLRILQPKAAA